MATITFGIASAPLTGSKVFTGTDQDMANILAWAKVAYADIIAELFNPGGVAGFNPTNLQIGVALSTATMRIWQREETRFRNEAAIAAAPPLPPNSFQ